MISRRFPVPSKSVSNLLVLFGILFFAIGISVNIDHVLFLYGAVSTQGRITALLEKPAAGSGSILYSPRCVFFDENHQSHEFTSEYYTNPPVGAVGDEIEILYQKENPAKARVRSSITFFGIHGTMMIIGLLLGAFGMLFTYYHKKALQNKSQG